MGIELLMNYAPEDSQSSPSPTYSPDISPCDFWTLVAFKGKLKEWHLQGPEEILTAFQEL
jgi:hypothetical protein